MAEQPRDEPPPFSRRFFEAEETFTLIGSGALGGKAQGLRDAREALAARPASLRFERLDIAVPTLTVIGTDAFDAFLRTNALEELALSGAADHRIALAFQKGDLPPQLLGDLWELIRGVRAPLAVRSSSLLEDALEHAFAGVYATKMIPNNQPDTETRFRKLVEAIKFVYASTYFAAARRYRERAGQGASDEKMAVIVQEIVGRRHEARFYPDLSAVARSYNFYPIGHAGREDGVVDLALGLGKTIVDGGRSWTYCPRYPSIGPPFASAAELAKETQSEFWAVNMGKPPAYDPINETEYMLLASLGDAEEDGTLHRLASTYDPQSDRLSLGTGARGARVLTFGPLLQLDDWPFNQALGGLLELFEDRAGEPVEIELALTFDDEQRHARLGFLQVRPMALAKDGVAVSEQDLRDPRAVVASSSVMGGGSVEGIRDIVFLKPDAFDRAQSRAIAEELGVLNRGLLESDRSYLLIGFGRWGSADPWLGVPVGWEQISGARVIVEAALPDLAIDMSQGSHFFHNLLSLRIPYFSAPRGGEARVAWGWLESLPRAVDGRWACRVSLPEALEVRVDARTGRGVVLRAGEAEAEHR
jgi:hypothetical protein